MSSAIARAKRNPRIRLDTLLASSESASSARGKSVAIGTPQADSGAELFLAIK